MSSFVLKIIAVICMFCDHLGDVGLRYLSVMNIIGRIAFPLFAFQLVVGYKNTSNLKKYAIRLITFALISQIPFSIFSYIINGSLFSLNIFFTLAFGLMVLFIFENFDNKFFKYLLIALILVLAHFAKVDYGAWGVFIIFFIYLFCPTLNKDTKMDKRLQYFIFLFGFLILCLLKYSEYFGQMSYIYLISIIAFTFLPSILMLFYNGKKGRSWKYFFYVFYPLHLTILDISYFVLVAMALGSI